MGAHSSAGEFVMDKADFEDTQAELVRAGFAIDDASYSDESFGSWLVVVETVPRIRVVWDGKDGWLLVEIETTNVFAGITVWETRTTCREVADQTTSRAVSAVREARAAQQEVATDDAARGSS
jgi:hypothetical protein